MQPHPCKWALGENSFHLKEVYGTRSPQRTTTEQGEGKGGSEMWQVEGHKTDWVLRAQLNGRGKGWETFPRHRAWGYAGQSRGVCETWISTVTEIPGM